MKLKNLRITNNLTLKITSLIFAYLIWSILSQQQFTTVEKHIPIAFYNVTNDVEIHAPESIKIKVSGLRKDLWFNENNAVHINAQSIKSSKFNIYPEHIFLRQGLNLISYSPTTIKIEIKAKK